MRREEQSKPASKFVSRDGNSAGSKATWPRKTPMNTIGNRGMNQLLAREEKSSISGEAALENEETISTITGDGGVQPQQALPAQSAPPAASPRLKKTTVSALTTQNNGGFNWGARWSIDNATSSTNGWIVQHVRVRQNVSAWHPPLLPGNTSRITPGQPPWNGLSESWYPIWEAWQVRGGSVFVGGGTTPHNADTYGQPSIGANTVGSTEVIGVANFYPNLTLPSTFTVTNSAPAWALPVTTTDPGLTGGTGPLDHNLTATWDGVNGNGTTAATTT
jgi:hypothetical protein